MILHLHLYTDKETGRQLDVRESFRFVRQQTPLPIYTAWDFQVGYGATGGIVANGEKQGQIAAEMALRILNGEPADSIPVLAKSPNTPLFDYNYLARFGLSPAALPSGSLVLHEPVSFYCGK